MGRLYTSLFLIFWYIMMSFVMLSGDNWPERILVFMVSFPLLLFALYLIWIDSKLPQDKQFRYYNSSLGKKYGRKRLS